MSKQETLTKWKEVSELIAGGISINEEFALKMVTSLDKGTQPIVKCDG